MPGALKERIFRREQTFMEIAMILARLTTTAVLSVILATGGHATARAGTVTFTWNPAGASPALTAGPAAHANV
jgi:hypothetical protein